MIAVRGNPFEKFKLLEYPDLVMAAGRTIVNGFKNHPNTECLFNWAETNYPKLFAPSGAYTKVGGGFTYRYYELGKNYIGVSSQDNQIYFMNGEGNLQNQGPLSSWLIKSACQ